MADFTHLQRDANKGKEPLRNVEDSPEKDNKRLFLVGKEDFIVIEEIDETEYLGVKIEHIEIDGWECRIGDANVVFPTLQEAEKEILRFSKTKNQ